MKGYRSVRVNLRFICCNHLLLVIPFEIFNANLCFALAFCFVLSCLAFMFFVVLQSLISSFVLCFFFSPSCLSLSALGFDCKKKKKKPKYKTHTVGPINLHHWMSLSPLMTCSLLPSPSLACCDWWLRCLAWAVLCERNSSPQYGLLADRYHFCEKCFNEIQGESVSLGDDPSQPQT